MAKKKKHRSHSSGSSGSRKSTSKKVRTVYRFARRKAGKIRNSAGGRALLPPGTGQMAIGALGAMIVAPMLLDKLSMTKDPGVARTAGRFALGVAGYHLINKVLKKPGIAQGFYTASLAVSVAEGYNIARQKLSGLQGMGAGSMSVLDVRDPLSPGYQGMNALGATADGRYVISSDGRVLQLVN